MLLNGAAAIAVLAFIGQIIRDAPELIAGLVRALEVFVFGALLGGIATVFGYITQYLIAESATQTSLVRWSKIAHRVAFALVAAAYMAFVAAAFMAASYGPELSVASDSTTAERDSASG